jgi:Domain of unknown function (DUF4277)
MDKSSKFELDTEVLGALPIINHFCRRFGLAELREKYLPHDDTRLTLAPGTAIGVVVRNLVLHREPVYALGEWAAPFDPALLGLADTGEVTRLNDDRGRAGAGPVVRRRPRLTVDPARGRRSREIWHRSGPPAQRQYEHQVHRHLPRRRGAACGAERRPRRSPEGTRRTSA